MQLKKILFSLLIGSLVMPASGQNDDTRVFTEEHPLVYEDAWDLWPYCFLNEKGEPEGYNIDLLKLLLKQLNIPYTIKLRPTADARQDLREGKSDLMMGMDASFNSSNATFGKTAIQLFTHSIVYPKGQAPAVKRLNDLRSEEVIVHTGSFSHHLMEDKGWGDNAIPYDDMKEAIQKVSSTGEGQILWNTLSLKWLMNRFQTDNLNISPVEIPHGVYRFMSNNPTLLTQLDSVYSLLRAQDQLQPIQNKWFYPERKDTGIPSWIWILVAILGLIALGALFYYSSYRIREKRMTAAVKKSNGRLSLILQTSGVSFWTYQIAAKVFTMMDQEGNPVRNYTPQEFARRFLAEDFERLKEAMNLLRKQKKEEVMLEMDVTDQDTQVTRRLSIVISVLRRDKTGKPTVLIGTRSDVTEERLRQKKVKDAMLRYQSIFNNSMIDMVFYDEHGNIVDMNERACKTFNMDMRETVEEQVNLRTAVEDPDLNLNNLDYYYATQYLNSRGEARNIKARKLDRKMCYELQLVPVYDSNHKLLGVYGSGRDVTEVAESYTKLQENARLLQNANDEVASYMRNIDYVLKKGGVRVVTYSPTNHILNIHDEISHVKYRLTQTRALALVDDKSKKTAQRVLNSMDNLSSSSIETTIQTTIRIPGNKMLHLQVSFIPVFDDAGKAVESYFGMCRDISEIKATEAELAKETVKAQEVETVKNAFLRNMSYEIRTPLNTVVGFAELFEMEHSQEDEAVFINEIKVNSGLLLKLINNILFLSRLDAQMIEIKPVPIDFAAIFEARCYMGWSSDQRPGVEYIVENPFRRLVVDIDDSNLSIVISQVIANAVQHTTSGSVRARYDYFDNQLIITIEDTGCGIPKVLIKNIFERFSTGADNGTGLGLSICHELVQQMGGTINIKSTEGKGTIVWIAIPCTASEIERK